jgi:hypothetical protein
VFYKVEKEISLLFHVLVLFLVRLVVFEEGERGRCLAFLLSSSFLVYFNIRFKLVRGVDMWKAGSTHDTKQVGFVPNLKRISVSVCILMMPL